MDFRIDGSPDYGEATVFLKPGETVYSESGAMSRMTPNVEVKSKLLGGFLKGFVRKIFGGESLFLGEYTCPDEGWVSFSPRLPGTVLHWKMKGETFWLTAGSFLACTPDVELKTSFGGLKALFSGEGAFLLKCSGHGDLFLNAYGGVIAKQVNGSFVVDTGHVVAWESGLEYGISGMGGLKQTLFSGEGLVMDFTGQGRVWVQSRTLDETAGWLTPFCRG